MNLEINSTAEEFNTQFAPLAVLLNHYRQNSLLKPLETITLSMKTRDFSPICKLEQFLISILAGCESISVIDTKLRPDRALAQVWGLEQFATQSTVSRTLDELSLMNIEQLRAATQVIYESLCKIHRHDWRGYLWLDFDLSGLPCGPKAQKSQKGYFPDKKRTLAGN